MVGGTESDPGARPRLGCAVTLLLGGIPLAILLLPAIALSVARWPPWGDLRIDAAGGTARARVTGASEDLGWTGRRGAIHLGREIEVEVLDGPHAGTRTRVLCVLWDPCPFETGGPVEVEVHRDDPSLARLPGRRFSVAPWWVLGLLGALGLAGLAAFVRGVVGIARFRAWLRSSGGHGGA
jgi:hypothetical protein